MTATGTDPAPFRRTRGAPRAPARGRIAAHDPAPAPCARPVTALAWTALAAALGLLAGAAATVVAARWPHGEPLARGPMRCRSCARALAWPELVPLASFLVLRGRCRGCGARIPAWIPTLEAACAGAAAAAIALLGPSWRGAAVAVLGVALVTAVAVDLRHRLIPDVVVVPATVIAGAAAVAADPGRWWVPVSGAALAGGAIAGLWAVHPAGMGLGDAKLAALIGAVLGGGTGVALAAAFLAGAAAGALLLIRHGWSARATGVPFAPFLAAGALVALAVGPAGWPPSP